MEINKAVLTLYTSIVIMIKMTEDNIKITGKIESLDIERMVDD